MPQHTAAHRTVTTPRAAVRPSQGFDGFTKWNALVVSLVIAMPNDAVADADAGDAMSGAVSENDAHYSQAPLHEGDSLIPDPTPNYSRSR